MPRADQHCPVCEHIGLAAQLLSLWAVGYAVIELAGILAARVPQ